MPQFRVQGPDGDDQAALEFFGDRFSSLNPNPGDRSVYVHATCATDTENIQVVDAVVQDIVMQKILEDTMIN